MAKPVKNLPKPHLVPSAWRKLWVAAKSSGKEEAQLSLRIGELEELIVGAEEREARRRAAGYLPQDRPANARKEAPLRYAERNALHVERLREWFGVALVGLAVVVAAAWLYFRLQILF